MNIQNNAKFGLFSKYGTLIAQDSLQRLENEAIRLLTCEEYATLYISACEGKRQGRKVLVFTLFGNDIRIDNLLERKPTFTPHHKLIDIKDTVDEILECDCEVTQEGNETALCRIGCGMLWITDLQYIQDSFIVKGISIEDKELTLLIENH